MPFGTWVELDGVRLLVDGFLHKDKKKCKHYVLSHFHADHTIGLDADFCHGRIYLTPCTGDLVEDLTFAYAGGATRGGGEHEVEQAVVRLRASKCLHRVPLNQELHVENDVYLTFLDANHCPGAAIIFLYSKATKKCVLHTGDFRAAPKVREACLAWLAEGERKEFVLETLYLDNTYCKPRFQFPDLGLVFEKTKEYVRTEICSSEGGWGRGDGGAAAGDDGGGKSLLVVIGTYSIGKENFVQALERLSFDKLAQFLKHPKAESRVLDKKRIVATDAVVGPPVPGGQLHRAAMADDAEIGDAVPVQEDDPPRKEDPEPALHPDNYDAEELLRGRHRSVDDVVSATSSAAEMDNETAEEDLLNTMNHSNMQQKKFDRVLAFRPTGWTWSNSERAVVKEFTNRDDTIRIAHVAYSEHSSFLELQAFVRALEPRVVLPTVPDDNLDMKKFDAFFKDEVNDETVAKTKTARTVRTNNSSCAKAGALASTSKPSKPKAKQAAPLHQPKISDFFGVKKQLTAGKSPGAAAGAAATGNKAKGAGGGTPASSRANPKARAGQAASGAISLSTSSSRPSAAAKSGGGNEAAEAVLGGPAAPGTTVNERKRKNEASSAASEAVELGEDAGAAANDQLDSRHSKRRKMLVWDMATQTLVTKFAQDESNGENVGGGAAPAAPPATNITSATAYVKEGKTSEDDKNGAESGPVMCSSSASAIGRQAVEETERSCDRLIELSDSSAELEVQNDTSNGQAAHKATAKKAGTRIKADPEEVALSSERSGEVDDDVIMLDVISAVAQEPTASQAAPVRSDKTVLGTGPASYWRYYDSSPGAPTSTTSVEGQEVLKQVAGDEHPLASGSFVARHFVRETSVGKQHFPLINFSSGGASSAAHNVDVPLSFVATALTQAEECINTGKGSHKKRTVILTNLFRTILHVNPADLIHAVYFVLSKIAPSYENLEIGIGSASILRVISTVLSTKPEVLANMIKDNKAEDLGEAALICRMRQPKMFGGATTVPTSASSFSASSGTTRPTQRLSVRRIVSQIRDKVARVSGKNSLKAKLDTLQKLLAACDRDEVKFLIRFLENNMRIGVKKATVLQALAHAFVLAKLVDRRLGIAGGMRDVAARPVKVIINDLYLEKTLTLMETTLRQAFGEYPSFDKLAQVYLKALDADGEGAEAERPLIIKAELAQDEQVDQVVKAKNDAQKDALALSVANNHVPEVAVSGAIAIASVANEAGGAARPPKAATDFFATAAAYFRQHCPITPDVPVQPMLASPARNLLEIAQRFQTREIGSEYKYDGERAQIHVFRRKKSRSAIAVEIFSRRCERMTERFPDVVETVRTAIKNSVATAIFEAEVVPVKMLPGLAPDPEGKARASGTGTLTSNAPKQENSPEDARVGSISMQKKMKLLPFQQLSTRGRKDVRLADIKVPVCLFAFDLLVLNGDVVARKTLRERQRLLSADVFGHAEDEAGAETERTGDEFRSRPILFGKLHVVVPERFRMVAEAISGAPRTSSAGAKVELQTTVAAAKITKKSLGVENIQQGLALAAGEKSEAVAVPVDSSCQKASDNDHQQRPEDKNINIINTLTHDENEQVYERLQTLLTRSIDAGCEGLMLKALDNSPYKPSITRSFEWLKLKKDYVASTGDTFDAVPVGVFYGNGKRAGLFGSFLLAVVKQRPDVEGSCVQWPGGVLLPSEKRPADGVVPLSPHHDDDRDTQLRRGTAGSRAIPAAAPVRPDEKKTKPKATEREAARASSSAVLAAPEAVLRQRPAGLEFETLCKCMSGFTDEQLIRLRKLFETRILHEKPDFVDCSMSPLVIPDEWIEPCEVWEIAGADFQKSPAHTAGAAALELEGRSHAAEIDGSRGKDIMNESLMGLEMQINDNYSGIGLRFPRFKRVRHDLKLEEATSGSEVVQFYKKQTPQHWLPN
eukprot:g18076.t1